MKTTPTPGHAPEQKGRYLNVIKSVQKHDNSREEVYYYLNVNDESILDLSQDQILQLHSILSEFINESKPVTPVFYHPDKNITDYINKSYNRWSCFVEFHLEKSGSNQSVESVMKDSLVEILYSETILKEKCVEELSSGYTELDFIVSRQIKKQIYGNA